MKLNQRIRIGFGIIAILILICSIIMMFIPFLAEPSFLGRRGDVALCWCLAFLTIMVATVFGRTAWIGKLDPFDEDPGDES